MKRYISLFICSLSLLGTGLSAQPKTVAENYLSRGIQMYADKNFAGCIDQMNEAKRYGLVDSEKADLFIALAEKNDVAKALNFLDEYPSSPYRHIVLCNIADYYLWLEGIGISYYALDYFDKANIDALNDFAAEDATLHYGVALASEDLWKRAAEKFNLLKGTRYDNEAEFYLGYIAYSEKKYDDALKHFGNVRKTNAEPLKFKDYYESQIYYLQNNYQKAYDSSSRLIKSATPDDTERGIFSELLRINGESAYNTGRIDEAVSTLQKFENRNNARLSFPARYILGENSYNTGDYETAVNYLSPVTEEDSEMGQGAALLLGQSYMHLEKYDAALMALQKAYKMGFNDGLRETALYNYGVAKMMGGRVPFGNSVATFEQFLKEFPNSHYAPDVQKYIVQGYMTDNNYEAALNSINALSSPTEETLKAKQLILYTLGCRALNTSKTDATTLNYAVGKLREAKAMKYDADIANECDLWIGEALYKQGEYSKAAASYKSYLAGAKKNAQNRNTAYYDLGYAQFGEKNFKAAYGSFNSFANSSNKDAALKADALNRMGDCLYYQSDFTGAAGIYDKAFAAHPEAGDYSLYQQAVMKGLKRQYAEKIKGLEDMIERFPNSGLYPSALLEIADAYQETGNTEKTISSYNRLVNKFPNTAQGRQGLLLLAITYLNADLEDNAVSTYKRIITSYPTSEEANVAMEDLKRIYTQNSNISEFLAFVRSVDNAPKIDKNEIEQLTFTSAENLYTQKGDISQIDSYVEDYPTGAYTAQALYYQTQNYASKGDDENAVKTANRIITDFPHSQIVEDAYIALATAQTDLGMAMDALATYKALESRASSSATLNTARLGVMRTARDLGNAELTLEAADNLLSSSTVGTNSREEIAFTKGVALEQLGRGDEAVTCWKDLISDLNHLYGTKAAFYLAQYYYTAGNMPEARLYAEKIIDANPPHNYWVARTFILLSDINRAEGNTFEADEYLKVLRENYPGSEADIFTMIEERLND